MELKHLHLFEAHSSISQKFTDYNDPVYKALINCGFVDISELYPTMMKRGDLVFKTPDWAPKLDSGIKVYKNGKLVFDMGASRRIDHGFGDNLIGGMLKLFAWICARSTKGIYTKKNIQEEVRSGSITLPTKPLTESELFKLVDSCMGSKVGKLKQNQSKIEEYTKEYKRIYNSLIPIKNERGFELPDFNERIEISPARNWILFNLDRPFGQENSEIRKKSDIKKDLGDELERLFPYYIHHFIPAMFLRFTTLKSIKFNDQSEYLRNFINSFKKEMSNIKWNIGNTSPFEYYKNSLNKMGVEWDGKNIFNSPGFLEIFGKIQEGKDFIITESVKDLLYNISGDLSQIALNPYIIYMKLNDSRFEVFKTNLNFLFQIVDREDNYMNLYLSPAGLSTGISEYRDIPIACLLDTNKLKKLIPEHWKDFFLNEGNRIIEYILEQYEEDKRKLVSYRNKMLFKFYTLISNFCSAENYLNYLTKRIDKEEILGYSPLILKMPGFKEKLILKYGEDNVDGILSAKEFNLF